MSKQSGFLLRQERETEAKLQSGQGVIIQYMVDTLHITMRQEYGWGYDRIMSLNDKWKVIREEYKEAIEPYKAMSDVKQEHMQRVFDEICSNKGVPSIPWDTRYPYLKKSRYDKKYKK